MASTDAKAFPIKNTAYRATFTILDADGDPVTAATALDSEVSKDGAAFADCTSEATEIGATGIYYLDLTATEMNADTVAVQVKTTSSGAKTTVLVFYPLEDADIRVNAVQWAGSATATTNVALKTTLAKTTDITGFNDIAAGAAMTLTAAYDAAKTASTQASVNIIDDFVDTEVGAIKAVTDKLDTAMEIDGAVYRFTQNALELAPGSGSQGQGNGGTLRFDDIWKWTTAGSVSSGQIRGNVTDWNTITELWIHNVTNGTTNLSAYLRVVKVDDTVRVQQENNPATWNSYLVTGAVVDMTTWVKIPVTLRAGAGVSSPATATNCLVSFFRPNNLDWTDAERAQIRHRIGIDGTTTAPSTGDPSLASEADLTAMAATTATSFAGVNTKLDTIDDFVDTEVSAIKAKTDQLVFTSGKVDANATVTLTPTDLNAMADALLKRDWNSVTGEAAYSALNAFRMLRNVWNTTGGTLTVKKEDGTTTAWTRTLSVDPTAQPITGAS